MRMRTHFVLLVLGTAVPLVVLAGVMLDRAASSQAKHVGEDTVFVARTMSLAIDGRIAPLQLALETLGRSRTLADSNLPAFRVELASVAALTGNPILLSDASGQLLLDSRKPAVSRYGRRTSIAYATKVISAGHPTVSDIHLDSLSDDFIATIDMPVRLPGSAGAAGLGVLTLILDLPTIDTLLKGYLATTGRFGGIVDRKGRLLQRTSDKGVHTDQFAGQDFIAAIGRAPEGWVRTASLAGDVGHAGYHTSELTGWTVGIGIPDDIVSTPLNRLLAPVLLWSGVLIAASLGFALLLARRVVRPITALTRFAISPAVGYAGWSSGIIEVDEVAEALIVSARVRLWAETALQESEAELRAATESSPQVPWTADPQGRLLSMSARAGMSTETSVGHRPSDDWAMVVHPADSAAMEAAWAYSVLNARPFDHEFRLRLIDESWCWSRSRATPRFDDSGRVVRWYGTTEDIQDRKMAETAFIRLTEGLEVRVAEEVAARESAQARLNQAQRMQALGQIASGIAHDFNNVLQAIGGALFLIAKRPDDAARVARFAALADDATQRGAAITGRLLSLSRKGELRSGPVDPALLLLGMAELLAHTLGTGIVVRVDAAADLAPLLADRGQLETVLINLATNARDAMPGGGVLTLSAMPDPGVVDAEVGGEVVSSSGGYIRIAVTDTGEGMDAATLARASEPFFTTKEVGHGTGLGLAMALGFAEQSGGALRIESAQGVGTTVQIWLPCAIEQACVAVSDLAALRTPRLRGRVLLVDDDDLVRATLAEQLQELGLSVVTACDGVAGLRALAADDGIALLVSDLNMPGMDGVALIQAAQQARLGLPAVLVTGYADEAAALALERSIAGPFRLLRKPVSPTHLADCIMGLLEQLVL